LDNRRLDGFSSPQGGERQEYEIDGDEPEDELSPVPVRPHPGNTIPLVLSRSEHNISRKRIDQDALKVLYRLENHGYRAYLVGGSVRDLLLGKTPKDFDISTDARPEEVRSLFRNSRIIGRRFRMNHVYFFGNKIIEVSTFRAGGEGFDPEEEPTKVQADNVYGTPETDAIRRDLTINGLFYDVATFSVIDYIGGIQDLKDGVIRIIGDPESRIKEDPVRMIRAVRHAARTGFRIHEGTYSAICSLPHLIAICPKMRVFEEFTRELKGGFARASFRMLEETGLLPYLMPDLSQTLSERGSEVRPHINEVLRRLDEAAEVGRDLSPATLYLAVCFDNFSAKELDEDYDVAEHIDRLFHPVGVSRKERERMVQILHLRSVLLEPPGRNPRGVAARHGFRDAFDLIALTSPDPVRDECFDNWGRYMEDERSPEKKHREKHSRPRRRRSSRGKKWRQAS
jgi:poly(A) polymerase